MYTLYIIQLTEHRVLRCTDRGDVYLLICDIFIVSSDHPYVVIVWQTCGQC